MESMRYWHDIAAGAGSGVVGDDDDDNDGKTAVVEEDLRQQLLAQWGDGDCDVDDVHAKKKEEVRDPKTFTVRLWSADHYEDDHDLGESVHRSNNEK